MFEYDVTVLGGGFGGVFAAQAIGCDSRRTGLRVCLISQENYFVFQPMLPEVAAGSISPRHVVNPIRQMCRGIDVFKGEIQSIDAASRIIHVHAGDFAPNVSIKTRHLVVALGAQVDLRRVPGMPEHSLLMQTVGDAMRLRAAVISRFEEANLVSDPATRHEMLTFTVVGGGYSGVETAGEIHDLMAEIQPLYSNVRKDDFKVILVHSQDHLLPTLTHRLGDYAQRKLEERGLEILLNRRVKAVTARSVILDNGRVIRSDTVISTVGNAPHPLVLDLARQLGLSSEKGRLLTDEYLRVKGFDWLWAAGDCAAVPYTKGGFCPPTAQFGQRQGELAGANIKAVLRGAQPRPFTFAAIGELAAIGHRTAVAEIKNICFSGFFAWWLWRTVYVTKLPGLQRKLRVIIDWTFDLFFSRDVNLLNPRYTRQLMSNYLQDGDILFRAGEPAGSLYIVKEGAIELLDEEGFVVMTIPAGQHFGERALLTDRRWKFTARAQGATYLVGMGAAEFAALMEGSASLRRLFLRSSQTFISQEEAGMLRQKLTPHLQGKTVAEVMNRSVDVLDASLQLPAALRIIRDRRHSSYPVVDGQGRVQGVLNRDDFFDALKQGWADSGRTVGALSLDQLPTLDPLDRAVSLLELYVRKGCNTALVLDSRQCLLGIVSIIDLLEESVPLSSGLPLTPGPASTH